MIVTCNQVSSLLLAVFNSSFDFKKSLLELLLLMSVFVFSHDVIRGLIEAQDETDTTEEGINYVAMRNLFVRESKEAMEVRVEKKTRTTHIRESAERIELSKTVKLRRPA